MEDVNNALRNEEGEEDRTRIMTNIYNDCLFHPSCHFQCVLYFTNDFHSCITCIPFHLYL